MKKRIFIIFVISLNFISCSSSKNIKDYFLDNNLQYPISFSNKKQKIIVKTMKQY